MKKFKLIKWVDEARYMSIYSEIYIYIVWLVYYSLYESALQEIRADIC